MNPLAPRPGSRLVAAAPLTGALSAAPQNRFPGARWFGTERLTPCGSDRNGESTQREKHA